jgi:Phosphatidylinositol-4-phosphate 5-Kinase
MFKTIPPIEVKTLRAILPHYHAHLMANPSSHLMRFFGLHRFHNRRAGTYVYLSVFTNALYQPELPIGETYDLKGRPPKPGKMHRKLDVSPEAYVFKDNDLQRGFFPRERVHVLHHLHADVEFLRQQGCMDYRFVFWHTICSRACALPLSLSLSLSLSLFVARAVVFVCVIHFVFLSLSVSFSLSPACVGLFSLSLSCCSFTSSPPLLLFLPVLAAFPSTLASLLIGVHKMDGSSAEPEDGDESLLKGSKWHANWERKEREGEKKQEKVVEADEEAEKKTSGNGLKSLSAEDRKALSMNRCVRKQGVDEVRALVTKLHTEYGLPKSEYMPFKSSLHWLLGGKSARRQEVALFFVMENLYDPTYVDERNRNALQIAARLVFRERALCSSVLCGVVRVVL